jgi:proteasome lid subunit RPN8/RPN11
VSTGLRHASRVEVPIAQVPRGELASGYRVFTGDAFEALLAEDVISRMLAIGRAAAPDEWMGILLGHVGHDEQGDYVIVRAILQDQEALARPGFVQSTHSSEARLRLLARLVFPDLVVLGWGHGHVRCGVFFSSRDKETQASWQAPYSVGIVVDPWDDREVAVYRGPGSERLILVDEKDARGVHRMASPVAEQLPVPERIESVTKAVDPLPAPVQSRWRVVRRIAVAIGTVAFFLVLFFFGYRAHLRVAAVERRGDDLLHALERHIAAEKAARERER